MREFAHEFVKGLRKGLRAFPHPIPGEEELVECYNLIPSENGLMPLARSVRDLPNRGVPGYPSIRPKVGEESGDVNTTGLTQSSGGEPEH